MRLVALAVVLLTACGAANAPVASSAPPPRVIASLPPPSLADSEVVPVGRSPIRGPRDALVTIVEFSDFQCPFCSRVLPTLVAIRARYGDDVRIVWKNRPLPFHMAAPLAAEAAFAADAQGHFWEMHDLIYQNQANLSREDFERYAGYLGLDMERFRSDLDQHTFAARVREDQVLAAHLGAIGTPTFFINGTMFVGAQPIEQFTQIIDRVLAAARLITPRDQVYVRMAANPLPGPDASSREPRPVRPPAPTLDESTVYAVPVGDSPVLGPANALVTIVEFDDLQGPFSARVQPTLAMLRQRYGNTLRIVWKNEPLPFHQHAMEAAEAAMAVFAQQHHDGFWRYHDTLFAHQPDLARSDLEVYAAAQGVNMPRFRAAMDSHAASARIAADQHLAEQIGASGVPHFFINGRRLVGAQPLERFTSLIDEVTLSARASLHGRAPDARLYDRIIANGSTVPVYLPQPNAAPSTAPSASPAPSPLAAGEIRAEHILVMYQGAMRAPSTVVRTRDDARARAEDVRRRVIAGEDFATLARAFSDEPGVQTSGGALPRFRRGMMVAPFENAAFALSVGEVSALVETPFGFHVIRRLE